ncbi:MAG: HemK/PrmC family methyltransferase [Bdellovibrionota bacterium]|nr:HemK/PrmC family methyltransferase [Bdellovibrionota bacterium]
MALPTLKESLHNFYESHKDHLLRDYPGLSISRLENDFKRFLEKSELSFDPLILNGPNNSLSEKFFSSLKEGIPLEQIINEAYFYKSEFFVNENVLIPRNETEILVEKVVSFIRKIKKEDISLVDIGTGSGAIILSILADVLDVKINALATDLSAKALEIAKTNAFRLDFKIADSHQLCFKIGDRLFEIEDKFDIIVSNPPYIKESGDRFKVHERVHSYEPHMALYLKDEEHDEWFNTFFKQVDECLKPQGLFMMEGHEDHLNYLEKNFRELVVLNDYQEIKVVKDYTQRDRFLWALKK